MKILGIETSCDETATSVASGMRGRVNILSNIVSSQIEIHKKYGGVVPEIAAREHVLNILPVINEALDKAKTNYKKIDAIAVTLGPGLVSSLIVGVETAKSLALTWDKPVIGINHIEGHMYANFIGKPKVEFPALVLTVSGGHTMLVLMKGHGKYKLIGETRDDAAGEAFDKASKLMNLGYPGGKVVGQRAIKAKKHNIKLPRPMLDSPSFDFSFSGLKTALLYKIQKDKNWKKKVNEYCSEFQDAVLDCLVKKTVKAVKKYKVKNVMLAGGVAASPELRKRLKEEVEKNKGVKFFMPELSYTTDNAAMVACAGYYHAIREDFTSWKKLKVDCNFELK